ncbi:MAG TPA: aldehyde ferredoxin oxidoreductase family protein [Coprothermobacter proteolyticus]|nr:aldehyde ferredoxin oxidoreductase family protein [Coprothermobacter proteolyticus]HPO83993.1 aldehyde ferredoxin oxidoreductase family protein [Coprothermobacter proteolyticus]HPU70210.1 aldehyde ferredoxin oxidoreductase family protein [Coprothermobacter proteolyticus]
MKGTLGKVLEVDLSSKTVEVRPIEDKTMYDYLGGLGLATRLLFDQTRPQIDALSEENVLVIAPGLLVGSGLPTASKTTLTFKSPLTNGFGRSVAGAYLGVELKKAGYDALVIKGKSDKPVYLFIDDDHVEIRDASHLWGKDAIETQELLKAELGNVRTGAIGYAGEKLSKISGVDFEERQAGRAGGGAVMGSKMLKAIAVRGTKNIPYANVEALRETIKKWNQKIVGSPVQELDMKYGSGEFYEWVNKIMGVFPVKNWQQSYFEDSFNAHPDGKSPLDPYYWAPLYTEKHHPCPNCNKPCGRHIVFKEGKYAPLRVEGVEYELLYSLGGALGIDDIEVTAKLNSICDRAGLDGISAGVTLAWAMEAYERGLLTKEDTDGLDLRFGNSDAAVAAMEKLANREGKLGELLSNGVKEASRKLGKGSEKFALEVKGLEPPAYDVRGLKGMALALAVSVRGACHLTGGIYAPELTGSFWEFSNIDRLSSEWKGYEVKTGEDFMTVYDVLGLCKFSRSLFWLEEDVVDAIEAVTGIRFTIEQLMAIGERIYNLQRLFNIREGFTRKDDYLPYRVTHEPISNGVTKGSYVSEEELQDMLDQYYMARGWSKEGVPTKMHLKRLGLVEEAEVFGAPI